MRSLADLLGLNRWSKAADVSDAAERYSESTASGAAYLMTSFAQPNEERVAAGFSNNMQAYQTNAVVFGIVQTRMSIFSEAQFKWQRQSDRGLYGDPSLAILENPWPNGSSGDLLARAEQDASIAGAAYIRNAGTQLERLHPEWVTVCSELVRDPITDTQYRTLRGYWYQPPASEKRDPELYLPDEVAHWTPIPDPQGNFGGISWLGAVLREIDADNQMTDYKRAYLTNSATPNLLVKYDHKISNTNFEKLRERFQARYSGSTNAFRTLILDEGADATTVGNNFEQMAFSVTQAAGENRIAVASGAPAIVVGLKEGLDAAGWSVYTNAMRRFIDMTMRPNWRTFCAALETICPPPAGARLWIDTGNISALQEGDKDKADTMLVLANAAAILVREGYTPDSVNKALTASDITLLEHTGYLSVQLQEPGTHNLAGPGQPVDPPPGAAAPTAPQPPKGGAA